MRERYRIFLMQMLAFVAGDLGVDETRELVRELVEDPEGAVWDFLHKLKAHPEKALAVAAAAGREVEETIGWTGSDTEASS